MAPDTPVRVSRSPGLALLVSSAKSARPIDTDDADEEGMDESFPCFLFMSEESYSIRSFIVLIGLDNKGANFPLLSLSSRKFS